MLPKESNYVPCLRWKQGEYQALMRLLEATKTKIKPLIEVPEIGFDFETRRNTKTIDMQIEVAAKRIQKKWETRICFVDTPFVSPETRLSNGRHPTEILFAYLYQRECQAIPVTGPNRDKSQISAATEAAKRSQLGCCCRIGIEDAAKSDTVDNIVDFVQVSEIEGDRWDLILDLASPSFEPIDGFAKLVSVILDRLNGAADWRSVTLLATSFPSTMGSITRGIEIIDRNEWRLFKTITRIQKKAGHSLPIFGDYVIKHPQPIILDMRLVKPSATIRYAIDDAWVIVKGQNVRDFKFDQYEELCKSLVESGHFLGEWFSVGDKYIADCAVGLVSTGNLTTWRWVGTNHHIEKVAHDVSTFASLEGTA